MAIQYFFQFFNFQLFVCNFLITVIGRWLAWKIRNGSKVRLGKDTWIGGGKSFRLLMLLRAQLHCRGLYTLPDIGQRGAMENGFQAWTKAKDLGLRRQLAT